MRFTGETADMLQGGDELLLDAVQLVVGGVEEAGLQAACLDVANEGFDGGMSQGVLRVGLAAGEIGLDGMMGFWGFESPEDLVLGLAIQEGNEVALEGALGFGEGFGGSDQQLVGGDVDILDLRQELEGLLGQGHPLTGGAFGDVRAGLLEPGAELAVREDVARFQEERAEIDGTFHGLANLGLGFAPASIDFRGDGIKVAGGG